MIRIIIMLTLVIRAFGFAPNLIRALDVVLSRGVDNVGGILHELLRYGVVFPPLMTAR